MPEFVEIGVLEVPVGGPAWGGEVGVDAGLDGFIDVGEAPDVVFDELVGAVAFFDEGLGVETGVGGVVHGPCSRDGRPLVTHLMTPDLLTLFLPQGRSSGGQRLPRHILWRLAGKAHGLL